QNHHHFPTRRSSDLRGKANHLALVFINNNMIVSAKWLAQAEHNAGNIILHRIANCKAYRQTYYTGAAENGRHQCSRAKQVKRDKDRKSTRLNSSHVK